ncbi:MAG: hypothetical protein J6Y02_03775 [Pseudobutyrivibrio sp.]|nr:hypothetical protein [Pseudobutyrivibrio sp.]
MDLFKAIDAMQNPQATMFQYAMQGMIAQHPEEWQQAQQMFAGKSKSEQLKTLRKLYKEKGMDLDAVAKQYGVKI